MADPNKEEMLLVSDVCPSRDQASRMRDLAPLYGYRFVESTDPRGYHRWFTPYKGVLHDPDGLARAIADIESVGLPGR